MSAGDAARLRSGALEVNPPNAYIRLERKGVELIGSASSDGQSWTEISRATLNAPPDKMLVGFAVNGADKQDTGVFSLLTFCDIVLTGSVPAPNPPKGLTAAPADQKVDLSWGDPDPGPEFTGFAVLRDGNKIATVPATQKAYSDGGLVNGTQHCYTVRAVNGSAESADSGQAWATPSPGGAIFHRGDSDDNGQLQLTDAVRILGFLFLGGLAPAAPGPPGRLKQGQRLLFTTKASADPG